MDSRKSTLSLFSNSSKSNGEGETERGILKSNHMQTSVCPNKWQHKVHMGGVNYTQREDQKYSQRRWREGWAFMQGNFEIFRNRGLVPWNQSRGSQPEWHCPSQGHLEMGAGGWAGRIPGEHYSLSVKVERGARGTKYCSVPMADLHNQIQNANYIFRGGQNGWSYVVG